MHIFNYCFKVLLFQIFIERKKVKYQSNENYNRYIKYAAPKGYPVPMPSFKMELFETKVKSYL